MTDSTDGDGAGGSSGSQFLGPISGLLSIVFAVMAGASLSYALGRPPQMLLVPVGLAAASVGCIYLKRRLNAAAGEEAEGGGAEA